MPTTNPFRHARWIANRPMGGVYVGAPAPYFRKGFTLPLAAKSARLFVTALGLHECELNGQRISDEVFSPGWTDYAKRIVFSEYEVTALLRPGENALGAVLGDGWYCGRTGWIQRQSYGDRPRLIARLEVTLEDGSTFEIVTDESWKTSFGPILENDLLGGESYDARMELGRWSEPGCDESDWDRVKIVADPPAELVPRVGPPVRRHEKIEPISRRDLGNNDTCLVIFDLGQNFSGRVRLEIETVAGATVILRFAEILNPDGSLYTANLRTARATDYYTTKSDGMETWEPRFTFHGFRYVEARVWKPVKQIRVTGMSGVERDARDPDLLDRFPDAGLDVTKAVEGEAWFPGLHAVAFRRVVVGGARGPSLVTRPRRDKRPRRPI